MWRPRRSVRHGFESCQCSFGSDDRVAQTRVESGRAQDAPADRYTDCVNRVLSIFTIVAVLASGAASQPQRFVLAIARFDGTLVPFAAYDDRRWERAWPEAGEQKNGPAALDGIASVWRTRREAVPATWRVWPVSGTGSIQARVSGAQVVEAHCESQVALETDLPPARAKHPLKFGIGVDTDLPLGAIEQVQSGDPRWKTAEQIVTASFSKLEIAQSRMANDPLPRDRSAPAVHITELYGERRRPGSPLYFVAEKRYRAARSPYDAQCHRRTVVTGWLFPTTGGALTLVDPTTFLTDCDRKEVTAAWPLGAVHLSDSLFWVLQEHGYEGEEYRIADLRSSAIRYRVTFHAGGC